MSNDDCCPGFEKGRCKFNPLKVCKYCSSGEDALSESAALLGEKYDVAATEYEMKFTYDASLGDEFGAKMFSNIIKEYDKYLLSKYYNKKTVEDFAKILRDSNADYIVIADAMSVSIVSASRCTVVVAASSIMLRNSTSAMSKFFSL